MPSFTSSIECWIFQLYAELVPTVQTVQQTAEIPQVRCLVVDAPMNCSDKFQQFWVPRAQRFVRQDTCTVTVTRWLLDEFHDFLREGADSDPEVDFLLLSSVEVGKW